MTDTKPVMKTMLFLLLALSGFLLSCKPSLPEQEKEPVGESPEKTFLHIGDKIPDQVFAISNYRKPTARISDFKGKAVLLDLWGVNCKGCIKAMPKMQALQEQFKDDLQIIYVTRDSKQQVAKLAERLALVRNNNLPSVTGEDSLAHRFDYKFVPRHVWVNKNGVIQYITSSEKTTEENLRKFLLGESLNFGENVDISVNSDNPLLVELHPYLGNKLAVYSYLAPRKSSRYSFGGSDGRRTDKNGNIKGLYNTAASIQRLYKMAFDKMVLERDSRVVMEFEGWESHLPDYTSGENLYIYDLMIHTGWPDEKVFLYIKWQLDLFFDIKSSLQNRMVDCYILKVTAAEKLKTKSPEDTPYSELVDQVYHFKNKPWFTIVPSLNGFGIDRTPKEIIDETGLERTFKVDMQISMDFTDLDKVNRSLQPYGLRIVEEKRELEVIVLEDYTLSN